MSDNLPPGVSISDIPGEGDEDQAWDALTDKMLDECANLDLDTITRIVDVGFILIKALQEEKYEEASETLIRSFGEYKAAKLLRALEDAL